MMGMAWSRGYGTEKLTREESFFLLSSSSGWQGCSGAFIVSGELNITSLAERIVRLQA